MTATRLPQVDRILREERLAPMHRRIKHEILTALVREEVNRLRASGETADAAAVAESVAQQAEALLKPALRRVINATGVVLNTNLGRAPIDPGPLSDLVAVGAGYCNLEIDLDSGKRGRRSDRLSRLLQLITGCEAAIAVNNNAAAVVLAVSALARGKKVAVSRGELIEIGGSFRLPDVIESAGGILDEVGTTNRTRLQDYRAAVENGAAMLMRCHRSNFQITGFTENPRLEELVALASEMKVPFVEDLGSGLLCRFAPDSAIGSEPTVQDAVAAGCDIVCFSGDKLLGGPQCGFIVGKQDLIERLHKHPLYRAMRLDKLTLALLERTLLSYLSPASAESVPVLRMLAVDSSHLQARAERFLGTISDGIKNLAPQVVPTKAAPGGGSLPGAEVESWGLAITAKNRSCNGLAKMLRQCDPPVIAVVQNEQVILDFRTIFESDEADLLAALNRVDERIT